MSYLRGFIPWIVFGVLSTFDWRWAAVAALASGVFLLWRDRRCGVAADALILDVSTIVYFTALAWAVSRAKRAVVGSRRIERLTGAVMIGLGLRVALESR